MYIICEALPVFDSWECDAVIIPMQVVENFKTFLFDKNKYYEIWKVLSDGTLSLVKEWDEKI